MSKKQWLVLLMLFLMYLLLGAFIFYQIERDIEHEKLETARKERKEINDLLEKHYVPSDNYTEILNKLSEYCGKSVHKPGNETEHNQWTFYNSFYFAYTVVSTIGYGNLAPTNTLSRILMIFYGLVGIPMNGILLTQLGQDSNGNGPFFIMYQIFLIFWISFGLGYIVMIMTFIARGMRSKKIIRLEHKLAMNLKHTQSKIWNEFNKEVDYLRRVFNELQLSKVKRVYVDEYDYDVPPAKLPRSNSFPDLRDLAIGGFVDDFTPHPRRRANSEVVPMFELTRVVSETDLQRIDKNATFAAHAMVQPAELLARLVNILGYIPPRDDWDQNEDQSKQADIQSDTQSKSIDSGLNNSESNWKIGSERFLFAKPRSRAASETGYTTRNNSVNQNTEWTWSGPVTSHTKEMMTNDTVSSSKENSGKPYRKFPSLALPITAPKNFFPKWRKQFTSKRTSDVGSEKTVEMTNGSERSYQRANSISPIDPPPAYLDETKDDSRAYYTHTGGNLSSYLEGNNLLEETSLADFLRALTALHTRVGTVPDEYVAKPKRKMGTACLTPPKLPSLFTLFSQNATGSESAAQSLQNTVSDQSQSYQSSRRMSLRAADNNYSGTTTPTSYIRRESVAVKPRRFSLRPVVSTMNPLAPPNYGSPRLSLRVSRRTDDRNRQEPYVSMEPYISTSPKEPLVNMEGPPGISSPIKQSTGGRRFSIRPVQLSGQSSPASTKSTPTPLHTPKPLPKWKAGMLQRQISQMHLRRRARAFSLGDVHSDRREKSTAAPLSPLAMDNSKKSVDVGRTSGSNQKTVTIMSPKEERRMTQDKHQEHSAMGDAASNTHKPSSSAFEQKLIDFNDALSKIVQSGMQETNVDVKEHPLKTEKRDTHVCVIDNLYEAQTAKPSSSTSSGSSFESEKEKPSVPIDFYKPQLQVTIEKPAINPFEQYRAMTRSNRKDDVDLEEVRVDKLREKKD
ncbi:uncharacterized protein Ork1 isoform X2 [Linepithema humile]|uniref:uncharacterized protein Ork1 isoform X2 n=1 Tax=Linepithema humile TaxID=83485 RepID=UPI0006232647|nr:PREDICTED: open rectifier potassium channel protein 1 isoform X2 [Linepithema humile]